MKPLFNRPFNTMLCVLLVLLLGPLRSVVTVVCMESDGSAAYATTTPDGHCSHCPESSHKKDRTSKSSKDACRDIPVLSADELKLSVSSVIIKPLQVESISIPLATSEVFRFFIALHLNQEAKVFSQSAYSQIPIKRPDVSRSLILVI